MIKSRYCGDTQDLIGLDSNHLFNHVPLDIDESTEEIFASILEEQWLTPVSLLNCFVIATALHLWHVLDPGS